MKPENQQKQPLNQHQVEKFNTMITHLNNELGKNRLVNLNNIVEAYGFKAEKKGRKNFIRMDGQTHDIKDMVTIVERHNRDIIRINTQRIVPFKRTAVLLAATISPLAAIAMIIANRTTKKHIKPLVKPEFRSTDLIKPLPYKAGESIKKADPQKEQSTQKAINHPLLDGKKGI
ncbi:MAG: hypothetical protein HC819_18265 [Cyclobacteriaceae bacterium]|nr:hypothetical protein [Cyclobacteriaceae bacterium]